MNGVKDHKGAFKSVNDQPLVSIAIPVYNGGLYIRECLESVIKQDYENWECVIVDNCSKDDSAEIAKEFVQADSRFKLFKNSVFLNVMQNWNAAYSKSSDKAVYFKIVPADDWLFPSYLTEMVGLMEKNKQVGICSSYRIDGDLVRGKGVDIYEGNVFKGTKVLVNELIRTIDVTGSGNTVLFRKSVLKELDCHPKIFSETSLHVDTELAYDVMAVSDFGFVFKALSYTRRHNESITSSMVYRLNTAVCFTDNQFNKFKDIIPHFSQEYRRHRANYARIYLKKILGFDRKWLKWHKEHLHKKFNLLEIFILAACHKFGLAKCTNRPNTNGD